MYHITETKKQNQNNAHNERERLRTSFTTQRNGTVILRHEGRVRYIENKNDVKDFLDEIRGKNEDQIRSVIRSQYDAAKVA